MIFIDNQTVAKVLTMEDTLQAIENGHQELARGELAGRPRVDVYTETRRPETFHRWGTMEGSSKSLQRFAIRMKSDVVNWPVKHGIKVEDKYCVKPGLYCGLIMLFSTDNGEPLAIINDGYLQHLRVGALYALGAKYLARKDAAVVGILGSGGMAHSHLLAFAAVRKLEKAKVFSPNRAHRESFARDMAQVLGFEVLACNSAEEAAEDVDILATCTNSREPTVHARMLQPGMHLTQVSREFAPDVYPKLDVCIGGGPASQIVEGAAIDDSQGFTTYLAGSLAALEQAKGAARPRAAKNKEFSGRLASLAYLITGETPGRMNEQEISASSGIKVGGEDSVKGLQFVTVGSLVYDRVKAAGLGQELPTELFLQDIRD